MALGSLAAAAVPAIAGGAASAGASFGLSRLFGGGGRSPSAALNIPTSPRLDAGGLRFRDGRVTTTGERRGLVGGLAATFPEQAEELARLRGLVAPGFGALTRSRLAGIGDVRRRAIGNLSENLQRRRVFGSSFGQDALSRAEAEFAREEDRVRAESFLEELNLTTQLLEREFETRRGEFQTRLDELNLQAEVGGNLSQVASAQLQANARLKAELAARESAASGSFFGRIAQPLVSGIGRGVTSAVGGLFG